MTILLRLHNPKLQYVPFGKRKVHARWNGTSGSTPAVDLSDHTMCGRPITDEMKPMDEQKIDVQKLCGRCYSSLRTYGALVELVDSGSEVVK